MEVTIFRSTRPPLQPLGNAEQTKNKGNGPVLSFNTHNHDQYGLNTDCKRKSTKSPLSPSCLRLSPPLTDQNENRALWARVRSSTQPEQQIPPKIERQSVSTTTITTKTMTAAVKEKVAGLGTPDYRIQELETRHITIQRTSDRLAKWLPRIDPASPAALDDLYVSLSDDFRNTLALWVDACMHTSESGSELQWTLDVYMLFLRRRNWPPRSSEEDVIRLERNAQPWVSFELNENILLPPKDLPFADNLSVNSKRTRVSVFPNDINVDGDSDQESGLALNGHGMRPDIIYTSRFEFLDRPGMYLQHPAIRTFSASDLLPPYLIGEFKSTAAQAVEAQQSLALLGSLMLLERVKLRRMSQNPALDDIKIYMITCCGALVELYCMVIRTTGDGCRPGELLSYDMHWCSGYLLTHDGDILQLGKDLNRIHTYGQTVHLEGITRDLTSIGHTSLTDVDTQSYQYTD